MLYVNIRKIYENTPIVHQPCYDFLDKDEIRVALVSESVLTGTIRDFGAQSSVGYDRRSGIDREDRRKPTRSGSRPSL